MSDHDFTRVDARRYWSNVRGKIVSGWEVANEWDETDRPTHWRTLNQRTGRTSSSFALSV